MAKLGTAVLPGIRRSRCGGAKVEVQSAARALAMIMDDEVLNGRPPRLCLSEISIGLGWWELQAPLRNYLTFLARAFALLANRFRFVEIASFPAT